MAILHIPRTGETVQDLAETVRFLKDKGVWLERWPLAPQSEVGADPLNVYEPLLKPFMEKGGYQTCDVIRVNHLTPGLTEIRQKFLKEHTHSEDEVRFFVEGTGLFWFHIDGEVFSVLCVAGDIMSVPAGVRHWFDLGREPFVTAVRIFTDKAGWVPHYTDSGVDENYNPKY